MLIYITLIYSMEFMQLGQVSHRNIYYVEVAIIRNHCLIEQCLTQNIYTLRQKMLDNIKERHKKSTVRNARLIITAQEQDDNASFKPLRVTSSDILNPIKSEE